MQSVGNILDRYKGFAPGFNLLRLWLALSVLWFHSFVITGTMNQIESTPAWFYIYSIMPMFFALSGFVTSASVERLSIVNFAINRLVRIIPGLAVVTLISALLIGTIFTTFSLHQYFSDTLFWRYLVNMFAWPRYQLPGVFLNLPSTGDINQSIWSIPFELDCYLLLAIIFLFQKNNSKWIIFLLAGVLLIFPIVFQQAGFVGSNGKTKYTLLNYALFTRGSVLFPSFLVGSLLYWFRYKIPFSKSLALLCVCLCISLAVFGNEHWKNFYALNFVSTPPLVFLTVFIGCCNISKIPFYSKGDYSYGIYLYGYPLQQALFATFPNLHFWLYHFMVSIILVTIAATFSWHFIEKPILQLRKRFSFVARKRIEE